MIVVAVALLVAVLGVGSDGSDNEPRPRVRAQLSSAPASTTTTRPPLVLDAPEVVVQAEPPEGFGAPPAVADRLAARAVLRMTATGFEPYGAGVIEQCNARGCVNGFPVTFDANGTARFQYLVTVGSFEGLSSASSCRPGAQPCVVRITSSGRSAYLMTVFGGPAPPARRVEVGGSARGLVDGGTVRVAVSGFLPGEHVQAMLCAAPATHGTARCGAPGPIAPFTIDADGTGRTTMVLRRGRVGSEGVQCGGETACAVVVTPARSSYVPGAVAPFSFRVGPGARYDPARVLTGLLLAALLIALAALLVRITDWRKPTEADAPELDAAALVD